MYKMGKGIAGALVIGCMLFNLMATMTWAEVKIGDKYTELLVNTVFSDHMVLQRNKPIRVWGKGVNGLDVTVALSGQEKTTVISNDVWEVYLDPVQAGGPYVLSVQSGDNTKTFENILVGDVWLCSGQSNMALAMKTYKDTSIYSQEIVNKTTQDIEDSVNYPQIRYYKMPTSADSVSDIPLDEPNRTWNTAAVETVNNFSATAYYFGRELYKETNVPVGLILSAINGTAIQPWMNEEAVNSLNTPLHSYGSWYNGLVAPFEKFQIAGFLWYQGESNYNDSANYQQYFPALIHGWRTAFGQWDIPFVYAQLPLFNSLDYRYIREAQLKTLDTVSNAGMAILIDSGDAANIHPGNKELVGTRLSYIARALAYEENIEYMGPIVNSVEYTGDKAIITFEHVGAGLKSNDGLPIREFEVYGDNQGFVTANAVITDTNKVEVAASGVTNLSGVRYAFQKMPSVNLYNSTDLPASPFREDPSEQDGSGTFGSGLTWAYSVGTTTLTVSGAGAIPDYASADGQPWAGYQAKITKVVLGDGITALGKNSFANLIALTDIEIPSSVKLLRMYVFSGCKALAEITIPGTVNQVAARAFQNCTGLKNVVFEEGVGRLGGQLFNSCTALESVVVPASAIIDRCHINYTTDGVWFRNIKDFSKLTIYVYPDSDAYDYVTEDIYTITNYTENPTQEQYTENPNYMTNGGYILNYVVMSNITLSYNEDSKTATVSSPEVRNAALVFMSYDNTNNRLLNLEIQEGVELAVGVKNFPAASFAQKAGTTTKVMLLDSLANMRPLCPVAEAKLKINIYMAGDSIMRPYLQVTDYPQQGWGVPFSALFDADAVVVHNYARGGNTAKIFYEGTGYIPIKEKIRPGDYLVVGFIHNDYNTSTIPEYQEYLQKYIDDTIAAGATPLLVVQPPRGTATNQHGDFPQAMMEVAEMNNVFCVDTDTPLRAELTANLEEAQDKYWLYRLVARGIITQEQQDSHNNLTLRDTGRDPTHISEGGAAWVANYVAFAMKNTGILADYITLPNETE